MPPKIAAAAAAFGRFYPAYRQQRIQTQELERLDSVRVAKKEQEERDRKAFASMAEAWKQKNPVDALRAVPLPEGVSPEVLDAQRKLIDKAVERMETIAQRKYGAQQGMRGTGTIITGFDDYGIPSGTRNLEMHEMGQDPEAWDKYLGQVERFQDRDLQGRLQEQRISTSRAQEGMYGRSNQPDASTTTPEKSITRKEIRDAWKDADEERESIFFYTDEYDVDLTTGKPKRKPKPNYVVSKEQLAQNPGAEVIPSKKEYRRLFLREQEDSRNYLISGTEEPVPPPEPPPMLRKPEPGKQRLTTTQPPAEDPGWSMTQWRGNQPESLQRIATPLQKPGMPTPGQGPSIPPSLPSGMYEESMTTVRRPPQFGESPPGAAPAPAGPAPTAGPEPQVVETYLQAVKAAQKERPEMTVEQILDLMTDDPAIKQAVLGRFQPANHMTGAVR